MKQLLFQSRVNMILQKITQVHIPFPDWNRHCRCECVYQHLHVHVFPSKDASKTQQWRVNYTLTVSDLLFMSRQEITTIQIRIPHTHKDTLNLSAFCSDNLYPLQSCSPFFPIPSISVPFSLCFPALPPPCLWSHLTKVCNPLQINFKQ